tara:strand:+ start:252 stop:671 length:420 start_codon:yes stop_codon:yes gene_type:complete
MSWATAYTGSNNIHFNFPPIMTDGRNYSQWEPSNVTNEKIRESENINTNWEYRRYLQKNADTIIKTNQLSSFNKSNCLHSASENTNNSPYIYNSCLDKSSPYGYNNSDLKNQYLSRNELQSRKAIKKLNINTYNKNNSL